MSNANTTKQAWTLGACALLIGAQAFAAGFEKTVTWSGKHAGQAGIGIATVAGPESLYFNPAGLASGTGTEMSLNFSPVFGQFKAPFADAGSAVARDGKRSFSPIFGANFSHKINEQLGVGVGAFVSGGTRAEYEAFTDATTGPFDDLDPTFKSYLSILEVVPGVAYAISDDLKIGLGLRWLFVGGDFNYASNIQTAAAFEQQFSNLKANKFGGVRAGIQYAPRDSNWGLGLNFRSSVDFTAEGDVKYRLDPQLGTAGNTIQEFNSTGGSISGTFPWQLGIGTWFDLSPKKFRVGLEYSFSQYAKNRVLGIHNPSDFSTAGGGALATAATLSSNNDISLSWHNQHVARIGFEYMLETLALRAGYAYTSQVTDTKNPLPTLASPGAGHSITLGAGAPIMDKVEANLGVEYSMASGTPAAADVGATRAGEYSSNAYAAHVGVNVAF